MSREVYYWPRFSFFHLFEKGRRSIFKYIEKQKNKDKAIPIKGESLSYFRI